MNKYEVYLDHGRVLALNTDSGEIYRVLTEKDSILVRMFSSESPEHCPYELYSDKAGTTLINTDTATEYRVTLVPYEESV